MPFLRHRQRSISAVTRDRWVVPSRGLTYAVSPVAVSYSSDFEADSWPYLNVLGTGSVSKAADHARVGLHSVKMTANWVSAEENNFRAELSFANPSNFPLGRSYWVAISVYVPYDYESDDKNDIVTQLWSPSDPGEIPKSPPISLSIINDQWSLVVISDQAEISEVGATIVTTRTDLGAIEKGKWVDWTLRFRLTHTASGGIRVWRDSVLIHSFDGPVTYNDTVGPTLKFGVYKSSWKNLETAPSVTTKTLYFDELHVGEGDIDGPSFDVENRWWRIGGIADENVDVAYQPKSALNEAASYINLVSPGVNDAISSVTPTFDTAAGWVFNGVDQYLLLPGATSNPFAIKYKGTETAGWFYVIGKNIGANFSVVMPNVDGTGSRFRIAATTYSYPREEETVVVYTGSSFFVNGVKLAGDLIDPVIDIAYALGGRYREGAYVDNFCAVTVSAVAVFNSTVSDEDAALLSATMLATI